MLPGADVVVGVAIGEAQMRGPKPIDLIEHAAGVLGLVGGTALLKKNDSERFAVALLRATGHFLRCLPEGKGDAGVAEVAGLDAEIKVIQPLGAWHAVGEHFLADGVQRFQLLLHSLHGFAG
jgi:hypothetical protein